MIRPLLCISLGAVLLAAPPVFAKETKLERDAKALHALAGGSTFCQPLEEAYDPEDAYKSWTFSFPASWLGDGEEEEVTLIRIWCMSGAYNVVHLYYTYTEYDGLAPLSFAVPSYKAEYENDDALDGALKDLNVVGFESALRMINSEFDPETHTITARGLWRGIGDASDMGTWSFKNGAWALTHYEIDASYDGEINPKVVVDYPE